MENSPSKLLEVYLFRFSFGREESVKNSVRMGTICTVAAPAETKLASLNVLGL